MTQPQKMGPSEALVETLATNGLVHGAMLHEFAQIFEGRGLEPLPDPREYKK